eukprot:1629125-Rhodomonas_salina.3
MEGDEGAMEDDDVSSPRVNVRVGDWKWLRAAALWAASEVAESMLGTATPKSCYDGSDTDLDLRQPGECSAADL